MLKTEVRDLAPGTPLLTTDGARVTFVRMDVAEVVPARPRKSSGAKPRTTIVAVVAREDGTEMMVPPRSLHPRRETL